MLCLWLLSNEFLESRKSTQTQTPSEFDTLRYLVTCHIHSRSKLWYELWVSVRSYRHSAQINWSDIFTVYCEMQDRIYLLLFLSGTLNICSVRADAFNSSRHNMTLITRAANNPSVFTIMENAPTKAFSWLKAPASTFTFKTLIRHYAKCLNQE